MDTVGEGENGMNGERSFNIYIYIYILLSIRWIAGEKLLYSTRSPVWPSVMAWRDEMRRGEGG